MLDLVIKGGTAVSESGSFASDIGISDGKICVIGSGLGEARQIVDATRLHVLPGGVDAHCHIEEPAYGGAMLADDFVSASRAAACGGTTTIIPFINQLAGRSLAFAVEDYHVRASRSLIDYAFHIILKHDGLKDALAELPEIMTAGHRSVKVFMTYPGYQMGDRDVLEVMTAVTQGKGTVLVHCENGHCIHFLTERLEAAGHSGLDFFAASAPVAVEREAVHRAFTLAEIAGARLLIVHVSSGEALEQIEWARHRGMKVLAETCPQYLVEGLGAQRPGWEAAKYICSPPPRGVSDVAALWAGGMRGSFDLLSSDHCPYRFGGEDGKQVSGHADPHFQHVPPGLPGLELRLPLLFEEAVVKRGMRLGDFVRLVAAEPARIYGIYPQKGGLFPGSDADLALWDLERQTTITHSMLHDNCDYTPYEGRKVSAWPVTTISRGEIIWQNGEVCGAHGRGRFLPQQAHG